MCGEHFRDDDKSRLVKNSSAPDCGKKGFLSSWETDQDDEEVFDFDCGNDVAGAAEPGGDAGDDYIGSG